MRRTLMAVSVAALGAACSPQTKTPEAPAKPAAIMPGPTASSDLQKRLIEAKPGDIVEIGAGTFAFTDGLSLDVANVTIKGAGQDRTILSFKGQAGAGGGRLGSSNGG